MSSLDEQVLGTLRTPSLTGRPTVMSPKQISHHIGRVTGTGWGPSPQAVSAALRRLADQGLVERASACWTATRTAADPRGRLDSPQAGALAPAVRAEAQRVLDGAARRILAERRSEPNERRYAPGRSLR